jgi:single-strand DNA-binding protein
VQGINTVVLVGRLGRQPELRFIDNKTAVLSFPLATSETTFENGYKEQMTQWHNVVMWKALAQSASKTLKKGSLIFLEGRLHHRSYIDGQGINKEITEVIALYYTSLDQND